MATTIQSDNAETMELLDLVMRAGGSVDIDDLLQTMLADRLLEQKRVQDVLAKKLQTGLDSGTVPLNEQTLGGLRQDIDGIIDIAKERESGG